MTAMPAPSWLARLVTFTTATYWLAIFISTHIPNPTLPDISDKVLHFTAFGCLYLLLSATLRVRRGHWPTNRMHGRLLGVTMVYAAIDEVLQAIPMLHRHADVEDAIADTAGLVTAALLVLIVERLEAGFCRPQINGNDSEQSTG